MKGVLTRTDQSIQLENQVLPLKLCQAVLTTATFVDNVFTNVPNILGFETSMQEFEDLLPLETAARQGQNSCDSDCIAHERSSINPRCSFDDFLSQMIKYFGVVLPKVRIEDHLEHLCFLLLGYFEAIRRLFYFPDVFALLLD